MSKVKSPLLSQDAHGSFGKTLVFGKNFNTNSVASLKIPPYRNTQLQKNNRYIYVLIYEDWKIATQPIKVYFSELARGKRLNPYNIFFKLWFESIYQARYGAALYGLGRYN